MIRSKQNQELMNSVSPAWEMIENMRSFLVKIKKRVISESDIAEALQIERPTMAQFKHRNSNSLLIYVTLFCIKHDLDVRDFIKKRGKQCE